MNKFKLYKYMKKEFAEAFISQGKIRIGTLYDFRNIEKHGPEIGDEGEGTRTAHYTNNSTQSIDASKVHGLTELANMFGIAIGGGTIIARPGALISGQLSSPDLFVYCASKELDQHKMVEMGYDSCIKINDPYSFFECISKSLTKIASPLDHGEVIYGDRHIDLNESIEKRSYLIKPDYERFINQKEYRFVWLPHIQLQQPFIDLSCPDIAIYCEKII
ncbi:hypothetical protein ACOZWC_003701 [Cronobacter turicensis]